MLGYIHPEPSSNGEGEEERKEPFMRKAEKEVIQLEVQTTPRVVDKWDR